jgi:phage head maturation protease
MMRGLLPTWLRASAEPKPPTDSLAMTAPVEITAAAADAPAGSLPTFTIAAYDGAPMFLPGFFDPVIIELKGAKARKVVKILREHDRNRIVGHATTVRIDAAGIHVEGVISGTGEDAAEIVANSKNNFPWEASVGATGDRMEYLAAGKTAEVNGRSITGPMWIARKSTLAEVSFVTIGAAEKTAVAVAATGKADDDMNFEQWLRAKGFDPATLTEQQKASLKASFDLEIRASAGNPAAPASNPPQQTAPAAPAPAPGAPAPVQASGAPAPLQAAGSAAPPAGNTGDIIATINAAHVRIHEINTLCASAGNPTMDVNGQQVSIAAHAIANNWTRDQAELAVLRATRPQAPAGVPAIHARNGQTMRLSAAAIEASLCLTAGIDREFLEASFEEEVLEAADAPRNGLRGMGIQQLMHMVLAANGEHVMPGARINNDLIRATFRVDPLLSGTARGASLEASGFSSISLSGILSNVANKAILERFQALQSVVADIAFETDTNDFKEFTRYRLDGQGTFSEVGADGELKHIELKESSYANRLKTHGGMIALTRQMIMNDDLGAFLQIPQIFAELALHAREQMVFTLLLGNAGTFFGTGNGNYQEGAGTVLSIASLNAALILFRNLKNKGGKFIMISPDRLLVPPALEATANDIFTATGLYGSTTADAGKPDRNPHTGKYRPVISPYLGTSGGLSGSSDTAWYLLAPPGSGRATVQVGYLRGQRTPVVESAETDFNTLGMQWRSFWDFGGALFEPKSGVKSKGAA